MIEGGLSLGAVFGWILGTRMQGIRLGWRFALAAALGTALLAATVAVCGGSGGLPAFGLSLASTLVAERVLMRELRRRASLRSRSRNKKGVGDE